MLYRFGHYELDEEKLTLRRGNGDGRGGDLVALEPKPFAVLVHLLRRHPVLVDNQELLDTVWADVVVTRSSLARAVRSLRRAFGEDADADSVIRTERGRGYGIAVPVAREAGTALPSALGVRGSGGARARTLPLVGRAAPLAVLADLLVRAAAGRGRVATVVGEPGIGKTRLGDALVESASAAGWVPLVGRAADERHSPPLWPWVQVLRGADAAFPRGAVEAAMASATPELRALAPELPGRSGPHAELARSLEEGAQQFRLLEAVDRFLAALSCDRPLLVWIDDLHQVDASSLALFGHLARNASRRALLLVASHRPVDPDDDARDLGGLLHRLAALPHAHPPIRLGGLAADELAVVAEAEAGFALAAEQRAELHAQTGGNPYFAIELVRAGTIRPLDGDAVTQRSEGVPERIRAVVRERIDKLSAPAQALLRAVAVAGRDASLPLLARVLDVPEAELLDPLEELSRAELLREDPRHPGSFAFVHALVSEALVEAMPPSARVREHARVARALEALYAHGLEPYVASLAHHYGEAAPGGDQAKAVEYARRSGHQAHARLAFAEAAALYQRAIGWESGSRERSEHTLAQLWTSVARAEVARGDPAAAERASFQAIACAEAAGSPALLAEAAWGLAAAQYRGPNAERLFAALESALASVREGDARTEALLAAALARSLMFARDFARVDALSERALRLARELRDASLELRALSTRDLVLTNDPRYAERAVISRERVGLSMELGLRTEEVMARLNRVVRLIEEIDPEAIDREIEECQRLVTTLPGHPRFQAWLTDVKALRALWQGRVAEAEALLPQVRSLWEQVDPLYGLMSAGAKQQLLSRLKDGVDAPSAKEIVDASDPQDYALPRPYHCSLALRLSEAGREAEARDHFEFLSRHDYEDMRRDSTFLIALAMLAELAHRLGDRHRAAQLARLLEPFAGRYAVGYTAAVRGAVDRYRALLTWTLGDLDSADALLASAVAAERRMGAPPWEAVAHLDRARLSLQRGGPDAASHARRELEAAEACCQGLDAPGLAALIADARARHLPAR